MVICINNINSTFLDPSELSLETLTGDCWFLNPGYQNGFTSSGRGVIFVNTLKYHSLETSTVLHLSSLVYLSLSPEISIDAVITMRFESSERTPRARNNSAPLLLQPGPYLPPVMMHTQLPLFATTKFPFRKSMNVVSLTPSQAIFQKKTAAKNTRRWKKFKYLNKVATCHKTHLDSTMSWAVRA